MRPTLSATARVAIRGGQFGKSMNILTVEFLTYRSSHKTAIIHNTIEYIIHYMENFQYVSLFVPTWMGMILHSRIRHATTLPIKIDTFCMTHKVTCNNTY